MVGGWGGWLILSYGILSTTISLDALDDIFLMLKLFSTKKRVVKSTKNIVFNTCFLLMFNTSVLNVSNKINMFFFVMF